MQTAPLHGPADINLGTAANYVVVDLADGTTFGWNSGPETGNVLVGNGVTVSTSGGNNGGLAGHTLFYDSTTLCNPGPCTTHPPGSGLQNPPPTSLVSGPSPSPGTVTGNALASANSVAANIANATGPNLQTFASITSGQTITGVAGINVIDVANIMNAAFTLSGPANAIFVFNVSGAFNTNQPMTLSGGLRPRISYSTLPARQELCFRPPAATCCTAPSWPWTVVVSSFRNLILPVR
jgi:hypothetical protein